MTTCYVLGSMLRGRRGRREPSGIYFLSPEKDEPYTDGRGHRDEPPPSPLRDSLAVPATGKQSVVSPQLRSTVAGLPGLQSHLTQSHACPGTPTFSDSIKGSIKARHFGPTWDKPEGVILPAKVLGLPHQLLLRPSSSLLESLAGVNSLGHS